MENEYYYVYCHGILGIKTNIKNFKWIYGSIAPETTLEEYEKCVVKFNVTLRSEKELLERLYYDEKFQSYEWNNSEKTISFRRTFFGKIKIGYNIKITGDTVFAEIGENYYRLVKNRVMNLHGIYYLLSDLANVMLLERGFATLYASAIYFDLQKRGMVFFAPPNTGKTLTATTLCELYGCSFVGEDIVITDGKKLFSCPWTSSYRKNHTSFENGGSFARINNFGGWNICEECNLTDAIMLSLGKSNVISDKNRFFRKIKILNGYLFNNCSSPIIKLLGYFDATYDESWKDISENILENIINSVNCVEIISETPEDFQEIVYKRFLGESYENISYYPECLG